MSDAKAASEQTSTAADKIRTQVEFYFDDFNFGRDNFLRTKAAENDGWVPITTLLTFHRLKALTSDPEAVAAACKGSKICSVNDEGTSIRRTAASTDEAAVIARSIHAKPFDMDESKTTVDSVTAFFAPHGTVRSVALRYYIDRPKGAPKGAKGTKHLKPSVFVEFSSPEEAAAVISKSLTSPTGVPLQLQTRAAHAAAEAAELAGKRKGAAAGPAKKAKAGDSGSAAAAADSSSSAASSSSSSSASSSSTAAKADGSASTDDKKSKKKKAADGDESSSDDDDDDGIELVPDVVVAIKGLGSNVRREDVRPLFEEYGDIQFVQFQQGQEEGFVRFGNPEAAKKAIEGITAKAPSVGGKVPTVSLLGGDEEVAYWAAVKAAMRKRKNRSSDSYRRGGRGGRRGGRGGKGVRGRGRGGINKARK